MACNNTGTFYWAGVTFQSATQLYTDSNLTIVAPDGWYSIGGFYREMSGGILGATQNCPTCAPPNTEAVPCDTSLIPDPASVGKFTATFNAGSTTGAIIVIFDPVMVPDKCTWTYDGVSASEYSSPNYGYLQGIIGNGGSASPLEFGCLDINNNVAWLGNAYGSNGLQFPGGDYTWLPNVPPSVGSWNWSGVVTPNILGPYDNQTNGGIDLVPTGPLVGNCMMVVPKTNSSPSTIIVEMEGVCINTAWSVKVNCPIRLNEFKAGVEGGVCGDKSLPSLYTASPHTTTGVSNIIQVHDWIFLDVNGENYCPAGVYPVTIPALGGNHFVTVGPNSVVTNVVSC